MSMELVPKYNDTINSFLEAKQLNYISKNDTYTT